MLNPKLENKMSEVNSDFEEFEPWVPPDEARFLSAETRAMLDGLVLELAAEALEGLIGAREEDQLELVELNQLMEINSLRAAYQESTNIG
jgi:hypothetical protein